MFLDTTGFSFYVNKMVCDSQSDQLFAMQLGLVCNDSTLREDFPLTPKRTLL